jgi:hypothetical protein
MSESVLGFIGGSGLYELPGLEDLREEPIESPWGEPSDVLRFGRIGSTRVVFLSRHGLVAQGRHFAEIPIEERSTRELTHMRRCTETGKFETVEIVAPGSPAASPAFDVTPARLVIGLIIERGVALASREGLFALYPEQAAA